MKRHTMTLCVLAMTWSAAACAQHAPSWTQLSLDTCAVDTFLRDHPESDGRGVVIAVLDTGVDLSIPGLTTTPDGEVKVIDVQDFSGEGDTDIHRVRRDAESGALIEYDEDGVPIHFRLPELNDADRRDYWFGWLEEKKFVNGGVSDLNDNGRTDDRFGFFVTAGDGDGDDQAIVYVDTDLDRDFADEKPLHNYKIRFDTFTLSRAEPEKQIVPMTFAVNVFLRKANVVFHFDDGAHGTHVAGIAAGYRINGQDGFNGVAPGAKVISLKIGQNAIGGISTTDAKKRALEYAARFARERGVPVVCNLSYGVESMIEGNSAIDRFVNKHLVKNPYLVFCTSGGNEGPGLSSIGTPAAAARAITSAALLASSSGRDVQGFAIDKPVVTVFSSRGGEVAKPDIATPGWSSSTVPRYVNRGDYWAGTSMSSPYTAGLCALLVSDAQRRNPGKPVRSCDIKRALELSATPPADSTPLDCGYGVPNVAKASQVLARITKESSDDPILGYDISTPCANGYKGRARAAYWRSTYFPTDQPQVFRIKPVFAPNTDAAARTAFTRKFELRSLTSWCRLPQSSFYLRSSQKADVFVEYDASQLTEPGVHVGIVEALYEGEPAFRMLNTVVVPYRFSASDNFTRVFRDKETNGWQPRRYFVAVPPGASSMRLTLSAPAGATSKASVERVFDPHGFQFRKRSNKLDTDAGTREVVWSFTDELIPGVWEVDIVSDHPDRRWPFELAVRFFGLHAKPETVTAWDNADKPDDKPSGKITVTNLFERPLAATMTGRIEGFRMHKEDEFEGLDDELTYTINLGAQYASVRIHLELNPKAFAETTDIGVAILDGNGKSILDTAMSSKELHATVKHPAPGTDVKLKLRIHAGFAISNDKRKTPIDVKIDHLLAEPVELDVTRDDASRVDFIPSVPIKIAFKAQQSLPKAPAKTMPVGYLLFTERGSKEEALRVPIALE